MHLASAALQLQLKLIQVRANQAVEIFTHRREVLLTTWNMHGHVEQAIFKYDR